MSGSDMDADDPAVVTAAGSGGRMNARTCGAYPDSDAVWAEVSHPRNAGVVPDADAAGRAGTPGEGNFIVFTARLDGNRFSEVKFQTWGCPSAIACSVWVTEWLAGRTLLEAASLSPEDVTRELRGLPLGREHCAYLAVEALQDLLRRQGSS